MEQLDVSVMAHDRELSRALATERARLAEKRAEMEREAAEDAATLTREELIRGNVAVVVA